MALSTLRLRENQETRLRQYVQKPARPTPQDLQEVLTLTRSLQKLRVSEKPEFPKPKPVLPDIKSEAIKFTDCDNVPFDSELDQVCCSIDEKSLEGMLRKSQIMLNVLHDWWWDGINSLSFLNWWFKKLGHVARADWFKLECSILLEEISASFSSCSLVNSTKIMEYLLSILHEHPHVFCDEREASRLPDIIEVLVSSDKKQHCRLLSDVKCKTSKQEIALGTRTYCIISLCYNAVTFYKKLITENILPAERPISRCSDRGSFQREKSRPPSRAGSSMSRPSTAQNCIRVEQHNIARAYNSVKVGFVEVLEYMFDKGYVDMFIADEQGRNLVFAATVHNQHSVLNYLLSTGVPPDVNCVADNGNTPLHAAASAGNSLTLNILLKAGANPNLFNPECNGATPLHLAVLHNNTDCVVLLLGAGADPMARMGCPAKTSALDLAKEMDHGDILKLLIGALPVRPDSKIFSPEMC